MGRANSLFDLAIIYGSVQALMGAHPPAGGGSGLAAVPGYIQHRPDGGGHLKNVEVRRGLLRLPLSQRGHTSATWAPIWTGQPRAGVPCSRQKEARHPAPGFSPTASWR